MKRVNGLKTVEAAAGTPKAAGRVRRMVIAVAVAAAALGLAGCTEKSEVAVDTTSEKLTLALDWYVNPDHAGIYHGLARGFFSDAGIDLDPIVPSDPSAPIRQVAAGQVDLAISYEPSVMLAREEGLPVVAVAAIVDRPLVSLISLREAGIRQPRHLRGKTVAMAGIAHQTAFLNAILEDNNVKPRTVTKVDVGLGLMPALVSGEADAMFGGLQNIEGVELEVRGLKPRVVPVDELGIPVYDELVLVANADTIEDKGALISRFIAALGEATFDAVDNPRQATAAILDAGDVLEPQLTEAQIRATLPLLLPSDPDDPFGYMNAEEWEAFGEFMFESELVPERPDISAMTTNDYLQPAP